MTEALACAIPVLHAEMACPVLKPEVTPGNDASIHLLARFGFRATGRTERDYWDGVQWCDTEHFERNERDAPAL